MQFFKFGIYILLLIAYSVTLCGQSNVRAWTAHGQVWLLFEFPEDTPEKFHIYKSEDQRSWEQIGSLFPELTVPASMRMNLGDQTLNFIIPDSNGGIYKLGSNEGLFVETIREDQNVQYAITACNNDSCLNTMEFESEKVSNQIIVEFEEGDLVIPHLQAQTTFNDQQYIKVYYLWSEGRMDHWNQRNDFPVMGNEYTNGWPHVFAIWSGPDSYPGESNPGIHWLHGGSGKLQPIFP